jgi:virulence-associated protein VapD
MASKTKKKPSPAELLTEVKGLKPAKTYEFEDYLEVVDELKRKENSYADIAEFLTQKLGIAVSRGQVYRAHMLWLEAKEEFEREQAEAQREYEEMIAEEGREPPEELDEQERILQEIASDVVRYLVEKYPHNKFPGEYSDVLKRALAKMDFETRDELSAAAEDRRLEAQKKHANDTPAKN